jgi:hypothetical protein
LRHATELVSSSAEANGAGRLDRHEAATAAEGATMSDAFGVVELVDICRESERNGDAAASSTSNTMRSVTQRA